MFDTAIFSFSFLQGVLAFFAPCAVALLPGYAAVFVSRNTQDYEGASRTRTLIKRASKLAGLSIAGFISIYLVAGVLIVILNQVLKTAIPWIAMGMGALFIALGAMMLAGKNISLPIHMHTGKSKHEVVEAYLFGIAYGMGALGCLFPLFLVVASAAIAAPTVAIGASYLIAYVVGMSILMITFTFLAVFAKQFLQRTLKKFMPWITRISGVLLMLAGAYTIYYQSALVF